ncbi:MAG: prolipoprotein diacylglyceryl transferase [Flavobacterium sp.]|nr:prolipoprotein diacylglyceryl transferase [Flavobacterium sp.]
MIWNFSEGFHLGPLNIRFYSLMFVVAFGLGWYIMKAIYEREQITLDKLDTLFVWTVFATLIGARLGQVFFYDWEYFRNNLVEILLPIKMQPEFHFTGFAGLASHGAAISIVATMYFYSKNVIQKPILWILDRVVIPVASGAIFVRLGNFFNSEIVGKITNSSFGVQFIRDYFAPQDAVAQTKIQDVESAYNAIATDVNFTNLLAQVPTKHPAQLYEGFCYIFVFAALFFMYWKTDARKKSGVLFGTFLVLLWTVRFFIEYVKESQGGFGDGTFLSTGQWLSIPFIIVGLYFMFRPKKTVATV